MLVSFCMDFKKRYKLFLPLYSTEAGGELSSVGFMMRDTLAALSVPRTSLFHTRAIDIIIRTGHIILILFTRWRN